MGAHKYVYMWKPLAQSSPIRLEWPAGEPPGVLSLPPSSGITKTHRHGCHSYVGAGDRIQILPTQ